MRAVGRFLFAIVTGLAGTVVIIWASILVLQSYVPVNLPSSGNVFTNNWDQGFVWAEGTWVIDNEKHAFPVNVSKITCLQRDSVCRSADAKLGSGNIMYVDSDVYQITRWDSATITFKTSAICTDYVYTIVRTNARLVGTRTTNDKADCPFTEKRPLNLTLVDGLSVTSQLARDMWPAVFVIASIFVLLWWTFVILLVRRGHKERLVVS